MKTYTFQELKRIAATQGYKIAALEGPQGSRVASFNPLNKKIATHLDTLRTRLEAEVNADGVYTILLAHSLGKANNADRYPIVKGKLSPEQLTEAEKKSIPLTQALVVHERPDVLTYEKALEYMQNIADLKNELAMMTLERDNLLAELEEEQEESHLSETQPANGLLAGIKEFMPTALNLADRWFDLREKELSQSQSQNKKEPTRLKPKSKDRNAGSEVEAGTQAHLNIIEQLYQANDEEELSEQLFRLKGANEELYRQVLDKLGMEEEETE